MKDKLIKTIKGDSPLNKPMKMAGFDEVKRNFSLSYIGSKQRD